MKNIAIVDINKYNVIRKGYLKEYDYYEGDNGMGLFNRRKRNENIKECEIHNIEEENKITMGKIYLEDLKTLKDSVNDVQQGKIENEIKRLEKGIQGEQSLYYKFNRLSFPKFILQDIVVKYGNIENQIDFMVFTPKMCFVIECKNWSTNMSIDEKGCFRIYRPHCEKIKSPVEQNKDQVRLIEKIHRERLQDKFAVNSRISMEDYYKPVVVLANNRQNVSLRYAPQDILDVLTYAENLTTYMEKIYTESAIKERSISEVKQWMQVFLDIHNEYQQKYCENKFQETVSRILGDNPKYNIENQCQEDNSKKIECLVSKEDFDKVKEEFLETEVCKALVAWRKAQAKEEGKRTFHVFTDREVFTMVVLGIRTEDEMKMIKGINNNKIKEYGKYVLEIMEDFREDVIELSQKYGKLL